MKPTQNSILLVFADYKEYGLFNASLDLNGEIFQLGCDVHLGMFQDSCLICFKDFKNSKAMKKLQNIDIRFFPPANFFSNCIEFYLFESAEFPVYLHNAGKSKMIFKTDEWRIELEPNERKLVSSENFIDFQ